MAPSSATNILAMDRAPDAITKPDARADASHGSRSATLRALLWDIGWAMVGSSGFASAARAADQGTSSAAKATHRLRGFMGSSFAIPAAQRTSRRDVLHAPCRTDSCMTLNDDDAVMRANHAAVVGGVARP